MRRSLGGRAAGALGLLGALLWVACERGPEVVLPRSPERVDTEVAKLIAERVADVRRDPESATAHGRLGLVYEANLMWLEARDSYSNAIELAPAEVSWKVRRTGVARMAGDVEGALRELRALALEHPDDGPTQQRLGMALLESGGLEEAEEAFRAVQRIVPRAAEGYVGVGEVLVRQGDFEAAVTELEQAVSLSTDFRAAHYQLGLAYRGLGRVEEAERELALGADAVPRYLRDRWTKEFLDYVRHRTMQENRAAELLRAGDGDAARAILESRLAESPQSIKLLNKLAITWMQLKNYEEADRALTRALELDDTKSTTHANRAIWFLGQERLEEALDSATRAVELGPDSAEAASTRARVLEAMDRQPEAAESLARAVELEPRDSGLYRRLARLYGALGKDDELEQLLLEAVERWPDEHGAHLGLARLYIEQGRAEEAAAALENVRRIAPESRQLVALSRRLQFLSAGSSQGRSD